MATKFKPYTMRELRLNDGECPWCSAFYCDNGLCERVPPNGRRNWKFLRCVSILHLRMSDRAIRRVNKRTGRSDVPPDSFLDNLPF